MARVKRFPVSLPLPLYPFPFTPFPFPFSPFTPGFVNLFPLRNVLTKR